MSVFQDPSNSASVPFKYPPSCEDVSKDGHHQRPGQQRRVFVRQRIREFERRGVAEGSKWRHQKEEGRPSHGNASQEGRTEDHPTLITQLPPTCKLTSRVQSQGPCDQRAPVERRVPSHDRSLYRVPSSQNPDQTRTYTHPDQGQGSSIPGQPPEHHVPAAEARQLHAPARHQSNQVRHRSASTSRGSNGPSKGHHSFSSGSRSHVCPEFHSKCSSAYNEHQDQVRRQTSSQCGDRSSGIVQRKAVHTRSDPLLPVPAVWTHNENMPPRNIHLRDLQRRTPNHSMPTKAHNRSSHATMQQLQREAFNSFESLPSQEATCSGTGSKTQQHQENPSSNTTNQTIQQRLSPNNGRLPKSPASTTPRTTYLSTTSKGSHSTNDGCSYNPAQLRRRNKQELGTQTERPSRKTNTPTESYEHASQQQQTELFQHPQSVSNYTRRNRNHRDMQQTVRTALCSTRSAEAIISGPSESNKKHCSEDALINTRTPRGDHSGNVSAASQPVHNLQSQSCPDPDENSNGDDTQTVLSTASVKIVHWNAQGANTKLGLIASEIKDKEIDIMMIQDTRLAARADGEPPFRVLGYHTYFRPSGDKCHGLLTFVKNSIKSDDMDIITIGDNTEVLSVKIWINGVAYLIHNLYRTKGEIDLGKLFTSTTPAIVGCDINAHHHLWGNSTNTAGRNIVSQLENMDNYVVLNADQQVTTTSGSSIDITIAHARIAARSTWEVLDKLVSDHFAVCTTMHFDHIERDKFKPRWLMERANWPAFTSTIADLIQANTHTSDDINIMAHNLTETLTKAANLHIPKSKPGGPKRKYWCYDPLVQTAKRRYNQAIRSYKKRKTDDSKLAMREAMSSYAITCNRAKNDYWNNWISEANGPITPRQLWSKIRRATGTKQPEPRHPDPVAKANGILTEFVQRSASTNLPSNTAPNQEHEQRITNALDIPSRADRPISAMEVNRALKGTRNSSPGEDAITFSMLRNCPPQFIDLLAELFTRSLAQGQLPGTWKSAKIVPIPKKQPGSYRPISLLPVQSKLMERVILQRIRWIATPPHPRAMGFKPGSGTRDAVATLIHDISEAKHRSARKQQGVAVFLDLKKAFEMVHRNTILNELVTAGLSGNLLAWCGDFLTNRKAILAYQGSNSSPMEFENGTPQGSGLSPTFFNYAMNPFMNLKLPNGVKIITYADDIVIYCDNSNKQFKQIQLALTAMEKTAASSGFHFAPEKTKAMWFSSRINPDPQLILNDLPIQWVNSFTYLGVVIDKGLRFHKHAQYLVDRVTNAVNAIRVLASLSGVNLSILRRIFNATVRPILDYGSEVFCLMSASSIKSLQTAQNTALKKCLGVDNWTATDNVHRELNILPVANRSELAQAKLAHNIIQNNTHPLQQYIDSELHPTHRRRNRLWGPRFAGALRKLSTPPATALRMS